MSNNNVNNSKKLAKNTIFLYIRLLFSMLVSLYTSRIILQYLGVEDYGIYNVVGGVVAMFTLVSGTLSSSISRNLTYTLGKGDYERLNRTFTTSVNVQCLLIIIILLLAEPIGIWFLNNKLVIPDSRMYAANWVLQFSILTFCINLFSVPYNATIISHEKMDAFAFIGVLEVFLKLGVVFLLNIGNIDKLINYAFLLCCVSLLIQTIYFAYCKRNFDECTYHFCYDRRIMRDVLGFAGWNFLGSAAGILKNQGLNILLNLFFGPTVNAARAIATQVNTAIVGFVSNFMTALMPQITKAYAQGNLDYVVQCIYRGSKFSYFLLFFLSLPVMVETEGILRVWLINVPDSTVNFVRYIILLSLADTLSRTTINANNATGDIKRYQITMGLFNLMILPCCYFGLKLGIDAASTELISVAFMLISIFPRIHFVKKHIPIRYNIFIRNVIQPVFLVSFVAYTASYFILGSLQKDFVTMLVSIVICFFIAGITIYVIGMTKEERSFIIQIISTKLKRKK